MLIKNSLVYLPKETKLQQVDIRIKDEKIVEIGKNLNSSEILDLKGKFVFPGAIDSHVHFNSPGFEKREDFYTGSCAAAAGGFTTIIDMPCTSIPHITNDKNLNIKLKAIKDKAIVDYGLYAGVSSESYKNFPQNIEKIKNKIMGLKVYTISSMKTFKEIDYFRFEQILIHAKKMSLPVLIHAEDPSYIIAAERYYKKIGKGPMEYYFSRPEVTEINAIQSLVNIAEKIKHKIHIVHLATADAFFDSKYASYETAPHYLSFELKDFINSSFKVAPCIKKNEKKKLWELLKNDKISFIASDHAPCQKKNKNTGNIWKDYSGIPGLESSFLFMFSEMMKNKISMKRFVEVISENQAKRFNLFNRKGSIDLYKDADFVIIDPKRKTKIKGDNFYSKGKVSPYENRIFQGQIHKTILRGKIIYDSRKGICTDKGYGRFLTNEH